jgi:hypothetical protein
MIAEAIFSQNFTIKLGSVSYPLTPAQYLVPSAQYAVFGLSHPYYYSWVYPLFSTPLRMHSYLVTQINDGGSSAGNVNFIIGQKFLENYVRITHRIYLL